MRCFIASGRSSYAACWFGEQRVAADLRHDARIERRRARRHLQVRVVGVEVRARVLQAGRLAVLLHVGQDQDVRIVGMVELVDHVRLRRPDAARERDELRAASISWPRSASTWSA